MDTTETFEGMDLRAAAGYYKYMYESSNASHAETVGTMQAELAAALARAEKAEANIVKMNKIIELLQSQRDRARKAVKDLEGIARSDWMEGTHDKP